MKTMRTGGGVHRTHTCGTVDATTAAGGEGQGGTTSTTKLIGEDRRGEEAWHKRKTGVQEEGTQSQQRVLLLVLST